MNLQPELPPSGKSVCNSSCVSCSTPLVVSPGQTSNLCGNCLSRLSVQGAHRLPTSTPHSVVYTSNPGTYVTTVPSPNVYQQNVTYDPQNLQISQTLAPQSNIGEQGQQQYVIIQSPGTMNTTPRLLLQPGQRIITHVVHPPPNQRISIPISQAVPQPQPTIIGQQQSPQTRFNQIVHVENASRNAPRQVIINPPRPLVVTPPTVLRNPLAPRGIRPQNRQQTPRARTPSAVIQKGSADTPTSSPAPVRLVTSCESPTSNSNSITVTTPSQVKVNPPVTPTPQARVLSPQNVVNVDVPRTVAPRKRTPRPRSTAARPPITRLPGLRGSVVNQINLPAPSIQPQIQQIQPNNQPPTQIQLPVVQQVVPQQPAQTASPAKGPVTLQLINTGCRQTVQYRYIFPNGNSTQSPDPPPPPAPPQTQVETHPVEEEQPVAEKPVTNVPATPSPTKNPPFLLPRVFTNAPRVVQNTEPAIPSPRGNVRNKYITTSKNVRVVVAPSLIRENTPAGSLQFIVSSPSGSPQILVQNNQQFYTATTPRGGRVAIRRCGPDTAGITAQRPFQIRGSPSLMSARIISVSNTCRGTRRPLDQVVTIEDEECTPTKKSNSTEDGSASNSSVQSNVPASDNASQYCQVIVHREASTGESGCYEITAKELRIGSFLLKNRTVIFSLNNLKIHVRPVDTRDEELELEFDRGDIVKPVWALECEYPTILFSLSVNCAERVRKALRFRDEWKTKTLPDAQAPYFDPVSTIENRKRVIVVLDKKLSPLDSERIRSCYSAASSVLRKEFSVKLYNMTKPDCEFDETPLPSEYREQCEAAQNSTVGVKRVLKGTAVVAPLSSDGKMKNVLVVNTSTDTKLIVANPTISGNGNESGKDDQNQLLCRFPPEGRGNILVTVADLATLKPEEFLNDTIIDFYMKYLIEHEIPAHMKDKVFMFNTFFYSSLTKPQPKVMTPEERQIPITRRRHSHVKRWTKGVDLFSKDFILIPICQNSHWFLVIICYPWLVPKIRGINLEPAPSSAVNDSMMDETLTNSPKTTSLVPYENDEDEDGDQKMDVTTESNGDVTIISSKESGGGTEITPQKETFKADRSAMYVFDSLRGSVSSNKIYATIREYLTEEFLEKKKQECVFDYGNMRGFYPKVPQQSNYSDCGVFVLEYARAFLQNPPRLEQVCKADLQGFSNLFDPAQVTKKRRNELGDIIFKLHKLQYPDSTLRQEYFTSKS